MSTSISNSSPPIPRSPQPGGDAPTAPVAKERSANSDNQARPPETRDVPKDTVNLSAAAQSALREASETPADTAREAHQGDVQAKHLLAKQMAAKAALAPPPVHVVA